jgi:hypothetical protein
MLFYSIIHPNFQNWIGFPASTVFFKYACCMFWNFSVHWKMLIQGRSGFLQFLSPLKCFLTEEAHNCKPSTHTFALSSWSFQGSFNSHINFTYSVLLLFLLWTERYFQAVFLHNLEVSYGNNSWDVTNFLTADLNMNANLYGNFILQLQTKKLALFKSKSFKQVLVQKQVHQEFQAFLICS